MEWTKKTTEDYLSLQKAKLRKNSIASKIVPKIIPRYNYEDAKKEFHIIWPIKHPNGERFYEVFIDRKAEIKKLNTLKEAKEFCENYKF